MRRLEADLDSKRQGVRKRRRFTARLSPLAIVLLIIGALLADEGGLLGVVGLVALAQGIGLAVALLWLAAGHNRLSR